MTRSFFLLRPNRSDCRACRAVERIALTIDWGQLIQWQYRCLKQGLNGMDIPDLIIAQNSAQNRCLLYSLDSHFALIEKIVNIELFN